MNKDFRKTFSKYIENLPVEVKVLKYTNNGMTFSTKFKESYFTGEKGYLGEEETLDIELSEKGTKNQIAEFEHALKVNSFFPILMVKHFDPEAYEKGEDGFTTYKYFITRFTKRFIILEREDGTKMKISNGPHLKLFLAYAKDKGVVSTGELNDFDLRII